MSTSKAKDYIIYTDEDLLVGDGFQYGMSGATLWKRDKEGVQWRVNVDAGTWGKPLEWYVEVEGKASMDKYGYMEREHYIQRFRS